MNWYKGQIVFFRCSNPAIGEVTRSSDDKEWVEVKWFHSKKASRYSKKDIQPINGVLNYWLARDTGNEMRNATIPSSDKTAFYEETISVLDKQLIYGKCKS